MDQTARNPQSWNLYSYVRNNPLRFIDPSGNSAECDKICQESRKTRDAARKQAAADGIDITVIDSKGPDIVEVVLVEEPPGFWELPEDFDIGREVWRFGGDVGIYDPTFYLMPGRSAATGTILNSTKAGVSATGVENTGRLLWGTWASYPKVIEDGRVYAQIGQRLYPYHAVERMMPRGLTVSGRSISPNVVEEVIRTGTREFETMNDGVLRTIHRSGSITVITEDLERIVVTVITH